MAKHEEVKNGVIFPIGEKNDAYAQYFIGQSYLKGLVADPKVNVNVGNVTFEPGCLNNWHIHRDGFQILLVTGGEGWYQEYFATPSFTCWAKKKEQSLFTAATVNWQQTALWLLQQFQRKLKLMGEEDTSAKTDLKCLVVQKCSFRIDKQQKKNLATQDFLR